MRRAMACNPIIDDMDKELRQEIRQQLQAVAEHLDERSVLFLIPSRCT
jgi:hypothetical protein